MTALDVLLGFGLSFWLFGEKLGPVFLFLMIIAATLPDYLETPYIFLGWDFPPFIWFYKIQSKIHARDGTFWGILTQIIIVAPLIILTR